ncbi:MAG: PASTA domain-containing protein, partial [Pseudomonadota bacterium]
LPVQREDEEDFLVTFPQLDDERIQPGQLSTLHLSFEPRPPSPPRTEKAVTDVRGYTEVVARRLLGQAGFRVDVLDQATDRAAEIDRVISQEPAPGTMIGLNKTVTLFLGRASGIGRD